MKRFFLRLAISCSLMAFARVDAATLSWSADAPVVDEADIANFFGAADDASNVNEGGDDGTCIISDRPAVGQTFTTGSNPQGYALRAITLQHVQYESDTSTWSVDPPWTPQFEVRIGTKDGTASFTALAEETASMAASGIADLDDRYRHSGSGTGWYFTLTLDRPVLLDPDTVYGFSVGLQKGPYIEVNGNGTTSTKYTGGEAFGVKDSAITDYKGDHVFHLDMTTDVDAMRSLAERMKKIDDTIFFVETEHGEGMAFLVENPTGGVWMTSCNSVFLGEKEPEIRNANGVEVSFPDQVLVAKDHDLILFQTDQPAGLPRAESCGFEEELLTFSQCKDNDEDETIQLLNEEKSDLEETRRKVQRAKDQLESGKTLYYRSGRKVTMKDVDDDLKDIDEDIDKVDQKIERLKEEKQNRLDAKTRATALRRGFLLDGQTVALGPDRIEISAPITPHDSGGPVMNKNSEVVGISSHLVEGSGLPDWVTEGTRFEDTRRFALKLDDVEWMPMMRSDYLKETGYVQENFDSLATFAQIVDLLKQRYSRIIDLETENRKVEKWIESHNRLARSGMSSREFDKDLAALVEMIKRLEKDAGRIRWVSIPYYQEQLTELEELYRRIRERLEKSMEDD